MYKSAYYIEVNLICVIFLSLMYRKYNDAKLATFADKCFKYSIISSELMCITDALAGVFSLQTFYAARFIATLSDYIYFLGGITSATLWAHYVLLKSKINLTKLQAFLVALPYLLTVIIIVTNPLTGYFFEVNKANEYSRGPLIYIYWVLVFFYLMCATVLSIKMTRREYNAVVRETYLAYAIFGVFPTAGFAIQVLFYGTTTVSVGIALGFLFYYIQSLEAQISEDPLTGLNNRKQMERYTTDLIHKGCENPIFILMIDIIDFKKINDVRGYNAGDEALIDVGIGLKQASRYWHGNYLICRYGGDKFTIVGELQPGSNLDFLVKMVKKNIHEVNIEKNRPYKIEISAGYSYGICSDSSELFQLQNEAYDNMHLDAKKTL